MDMSSLHMVGRILGKKRALTGLGAISLPGAGKLLFEGASVVNTAQAYWEIVSKPWFEWLCIVLGFALIVWAAVNVAKENEESRERDKETADREREAMAAKLVAPLEQLKADLSNKLGDLETKLRDATKLPRLLAQDHQHRRVNERFRGFLEAAEDSARTLQQRIEGLSRREGSGRAHIDQGQIEIILDEAERQIMFSRTVIGENQPWTSLAKPSVVIDPHPNPAGPGNIGLAFDPDQNQQFLATYRQNATTINQEIARLRAVAQQHDGEGNAIRHQIEQEVQRLNEQG